MDKQWTVYILECGDGTLYTGITDDLPKRLKAHAEGKGAKYTRGRGPLKLRYRETAADKSGALKREYALKRLRKREKWRLFTKKSRKFWNGLQLWNRNSILFVTNCGRRPRGRGVRAK